MSNVNCPLAHYSVPAKVLKSLPESQAGEGRHKCAACAYEEGFKAGREHVVLALIEKLKEVIL